MPCVLHAIHAKQRGGAGGGPPLLQYTSYPRPLSHFCIWLFLYIPAAEGLALTEGAQRPREAAHPKRHIQCSTLPL